jgi:hypothetical protein
LTGGSVATSTVPGSINAAEASADAGNRMSPFLGDLSAPFNGWEVAPFLFELSAPFNGWEVATV